MNSMRVLSLAVLLAMPAVAISCSDDEDDGAGGSGPSSSSSGTGAAGGTGGEGATGGGGAGQGGAGQGGAGQGGGGAGQGGAGQGGTGGGSAAQAFCDDYEVTCTFVSANPEQAHWESEAACIAGYEGFDAETQGCIEEHLDNAKADNPPSESVHCWHAVGEGPCAP
jgi:hypothetical protein